MYTGSSLEYVIDASRHGGTQVRREMGKSLEQDDRVMSLIDHFCWRVPLILAYGRFSHHRKSLTKNLTFCSKQSFNIQTIQYFPFLLLRRRSSLPDLFTVHIRSLKMQTLPTGIATSTTASQYLKWAFIFTSFYIYTYIMTMIKDLPIPFHPSHLCFSLPSIHPPRWCSAVIPA